jgi:hypothetical protein
VEEYLVSSLEILDAAVDVVATSLSIFRKGRRGDVLAVVSTKENKAIFLFSSLPERKEILMKKRD